MPKVLETYGPLRQIREAARGGKGIPAREVADRLVAYLREMGIEEEDRTYAWILRIEERGTRDRYYIKGLAEIYGMTEDEIATAAFPVQN